jgi:DNA gyrase subunit B
VENEELTAIEAVRKRPGMYIGDTHDGSGVLNMLLEVLANSYDQYLAGCCSRASIDIAPDGTIAVEDDGPGLSAGLPPLHEMLTEMSNRPTVDGHRPHLHLGFGGSGLFVVNALSERFELRSVRDGMLTTATYSRAEVLEPLKSASTSEPTGTRIRFRPDPAIFRYLRVPRVELARWLEDLSFLAPRFALTWRIAGDDAAAGGLAARVALGVPCDLEEVATHSGTYTTATGPIDVEVALAWRTSKWDWNRDAAIDSFVNLIRTDSHGSHVDGLLDGVHAFFGGRKETPLAGLVAAVSIVLTDVKYGRPDKTLLATTEAIEPVAAATRNALEKWAQTHADVVAAVRARVLAVATP